MRGAKLDSVVGRQSPALRQPDAVTMACPAPDPNAPATLIGAVEEDRDRLLIQTDRYRSGVHRLRRHLSTRQQMFIATLEREESSCVNP